jgi:KipI family sensor histidine kinase inhibitor
MSQFFPLGDSAITMTVGEGISIELSDLVAARARAIVAERIAGVNDVVPSYASVTVHYDPSIIEYRELHGRLIDVIESEIGHSTDQPSAVEHVVPVRYSGEDLDYVADQTRLSRKEVIEIHSAARYRVFVIGFVPGFAYLGPLDQRLVLPRRESPRKRVPAGSVAIAEAQTGVYPSETPGGWHLIGTTDVRMFDPNRPSPSLLAVGDIVRFEAV